MKYTPRIVRPRIDGGDWSSERIVLVQQGDKELLWWKSGKSWVNQILGYQSFPPSLIVQVRDGRGGVRTISDEPKAFQRSERLSRATIQKYRQRIDEEFGEGVADAIHVKETLVLE